MANMMGGRMIAGVAPTHTSIEPKITLMTMIWHALSPWEKVLIQTTTRCRAPVSCMKVICKSAKKPMPVMAIDAKRPFNEASKLNTKSVLKNATATMMVRIQPMVPVMSPRTLKPTIITIMTMIGMKEISRFITHSHLFRMSYVL